MGKQKLSYRLFRPDGNIKAAVFCVHGMQEHQKRYEALAKYLNQHAYACVTFDLPGHGETAQNQNYGFFAENKGAETLVDSAVEIVEITKQTFPNVPIIYFGHSMGTIIARVFLQNHDAMIDGCVLSGIPAYNRLSGLGEFFAKCVISMKGKHNKSKFLENLATGSFSKAIKNAETEADWLSYNKENVQAYLKDEMCGIPFTNQGYLDLFALMTKMGNTSLYLCENPNLPMYIFAGEDDPCIGGKKGFQASIHLLETVGYKNIQTKLFSHMRHETLHEDDAEMVMDCIVQWLDENIR